MTLGTPRAHERRAAAGRLAGKVALVTGAAQGLGLVQAELMAREGARLFITDLYDEQGEPAAASITRQASLEEARYLHADASSEADWDRVLAEVMGSAGRLDVVVNNAGISSRSFDDPDDLEAWRTYLDINATSVFLGTSRAAALMIDQRQGSIVNVSSIFGVVGGPGHPGYAASKAAVRNFTKAAAIRYGPAGIRVNSVHPGYMPPMRGGTAGGLERRVELGSSVPLRRTGEPLEVAHGVLFLASDEASYVTGTELVIDGGFLAQ
ncbi:SDR family NAD(P)-dependent oxidoreductase [Nocardioides houyundeii]|uniref:SDR family NAD(P)-dependent oxidoreductase n=1 Tax=Nocardioides houyundeii TaxID=2045452 RepID=UPI000DF2F908|nr:glucose 1-dehydrogenase [Nocardioides houyundeii]